MAKIKNIKGRQVFDSRGNPTIEEEVFSENGSAYSIVPSGESTGTHEAFELREKEKKYYLGKSVLADISSSVSSDSGTNGIVINTTSDVKPFSAFNSWLSFILISFPFSVISPSSLPSNGYPGRPLW